MTVKKRLKDTFLIFLPIMVFISSLFLGKAFAKSDGKTARILAGAQMPSESVSVFFDELEGASEEEIQGVIDSIDKSPIDSSQTVTDIYEPEDLRIIVSNARSKQANATNSGSIVEKTYSSANANNVYGNVAVRNVTNSHSVDIKKSLDSACKLNITDKSLPTVLIFHTHTTESYELLDRGWYSNDFPTRSVDSSINMIRVGNALCERLEAAGYTVIHDRQIYDTSYSGSYSRSREVIEQYRKQYPSLQAIIDVHRDGIKNDAGVKTKPVAIINGKKAAQIMIIAGCQDGNIKEFKGWEDNLNFAIQLQSKAEKLSPGLMRPIYFCPRKYNMDTSPCGILLEVGSDANTLSEAVYSASLLGDAFAFLLEDYTHLAS